MASSVEYKKHLRNCVRGEFEEPFHQITLTNSPKEGTPSFTGIVSVPASHTLAAPKIIKYIPQLKLWLDLSLI